jgi:predicted DNA-binding transcriptional regulator YafY
VEAGLIKGRTASEFDPNANITREEIAALVARAATVHGTVKKVADADAKLKSFTDAADIASTLKAEVAVAVNEGLLKGSNNKFNAKASTTRAEAAVVIERLINR